MTPSARLQAAIEILDELGSIALPADGYLRDWARQHRFAGVKDRAAIAERVYSVLRHRASFGWRMGGSDARRLVLGSLVAEGAPVDEIARLFSGDLYAPKPLDEPERRALEAPPGAEPPPHVQGDFPAWLEPELTRAFGPDLLVEMQALNARATVDLRVNSLRAERENMLVGLRSLGVDAEPTPFSPYGVRLPGGAGLGALSHTQFFQTGAFEFQDEASQIATQLCRVEPGQRVLDLAAGAGGKALALAALMRNRGEILAYDADPKRLKQLPPRARRAGTTIIKVTDKREGPAWGDGLFDVVLIDAPCSGSGTWRRNPELKWRLTQERLKELTDLQSRLLVEGARHTRKGGRLVYATCSVLPSENEAVAGTFLEGTQDFRLVPAVDVWREAGLGELPPDMQDYFRASPRRTATDGFFACIMERVK